MVTIPLNEGSPVSKKNDKSATRKAHSARQRGMDRAAHFAAGGDLASWRGRHSVYPDRRKEGSRKACRGRVRH